MKNGTAREHTSEEIELFHERQRKRLKLARAEKEKKKKKKKKVNEVTPPEDKQRSIIVSASL